MARFFYVLSRARATINPSAWRDKNTLRTQRPSPPSPVRSLETLPDRLAFDRSDWVATWSDPRNCATSACGTIRATSAEGHLRWLVRQSGLNRVCHSREPQVDAAIADAEHGWQRRRVQQGLKPRVRAIVADVRRLGISRFRSYPGRLFGWFFAIDRQVGFVLWEAHLRATGETRERQQQAQGRILGAIQGGRVLLDDSIRHDRS
ncbi:hypothetical protein [Roseobacter weihaiensis]|uniref:hypothetical protein n=1 Tax=Roseobacter weihaiensis TaxID=2763262 RepID=UPI001D0A1FA3|nr:hypothetical protein [Roseobacter sp. H9]